MRRGLPTPPVWHDPVPWVLIRSMEARLNAIEAGATAFLATAKGSSRLLSDGHVSKTPTPIEKTRPVFNAQASVASSAADCIRIFKTAANYVINAGSTMPAGAIGFLFRRAGTYLLNTTIESVCEYFASDVIAMGDAYGWAGRGARMWLSLVRVAVDHLLAPNNGPHATFDPPAYGCSANDVISSGVYSRDTGQYTLGSGACVASPQTPTEAITQPLPILPNTLVAQDVNPTSMDLLSDTCHVVIAEAAKPVDGLYYYWGLVPHLYRTSTVCDLNGVQHEYSINVWLSRDSHDLRISASYTPEHGTITYIGTQPTLPL